MMNVQFKKMLTALLALVAWTSGAAAATPVQSWTTAQGARVYFIETHALPIVDVQVLFLAGSAFDPDDKPGLASLTASLMDQGAGARNEQQVAEALADIGASLSVGAGLDSATLSLRTLSDPERRRIAFDLMADVMARPQFDRAIFKRDQARSIAALKEALTKPQVLALMAGDEDDDSPMVRMLDALPQDMRQALEQSLRQAMQDGIPRSIKTLMPDQGQNALQRLLHKRDQLFI